MYIFQNPPGWADPVAVEAGDAATPPRFDSTYFK